MTGGNELALGRFVLRALPTPGHTPDHLAYLLLEDGHPVALFSGGSLMVGTVGRTDLLGEDRRDELARAQYRSLHEQILTLPDDVPVYPTHGPGSFCSAPAGSERTSTIGRERATNPLLLAPDENAFVELLISGLGTLPAYFRRLPEVNRRGARLYGTLPDLPRLTVEEVERQLIEGAMLIDARPIDAYASSHIPGAVSNALRPAFGTWLASVVPDDVPLVFVLDDDQDPASSSARRSTSATTTSPDSSTAASRHGVKPDCPRRRASSSRPINSPDRSSMYGSAKNSRPAIFQPQRPSSSPT